MSKVFVDVGVSLDGYIAGPNRGPGNPLGDRGTTIHEWMFRTATFLERIGLSGGETSPDDALVRKVFERAGAGGRQQLGARHSHQLPARAVSVKPAPLLRDELLRGGHVLSGELSRCGNGW